MRLDVYVIPAIIILGLVFFSGCIGSQEITNEAAPITETPMTIATPTLTPFPETTTGVPTIPTPTATITNESTPVPTDVPEEEVTYEPEEPDWSDKPTVYPPANPDITTQNFTEFKNGDFMAVYPETWTIVNQTFAVEDTDVNGYTTWKPDGRLVTFTSEDGNVSMSVITYDILSPGRQIPFPNVDTIKRGVTKQYPNASADSSVYAFRIVKNGQGVDYWEFDVVFAPTTQYYPYSYTEQQFYTRNHKFTVRFVTRNGELDTYRDLKYLMMSSVITEGRQLTEWWGN